MVKELTEILGIKISNIYSWNYGTFADREIWNVEFDEDTFNRNSMNTGVMLLNFLKTLAIDFNFGLHKFKGGQINRDYIWASTIYRHFYYLQEVGLNYNYPDPQNNIPVNVKCTFESSTRIKIDN